MTDSDIELRAKLRAYKDMLYLLDKAEDDVDTARREAADIDDDVLYHQMDDAWWALETVRKDTVFSIEEIYSSDGFKEADE